MIRFEQDTLRWLKMGLLHEAISEEMGSLYGCGSTCFDVNESRGRKWGFIPLILSYCCNIQEGKDMSGVKH